MATTYEAIATVTVGSGGAANIEFTSIAADWTDLCINLSARLDTTTTFAVVLVEYNGETSTTNYSYRDLEGNGSAASSSSGATNKRIALVNGGTTTANTFGNANIYIPNYASSNAKSASSDTANENNATTAFLNLIASRWNNTNAITSIKLLPEAAGKVFVQYSTATLYGIKNTV